METWIRFMIFVIVLFIVINLVIYGIHIVNLICRIFNINDAPGYSTLFDQTNNYYSYISIQIIYFIYAILYTLFNIIIWFLLFVFVIWLIFKYIIPIIFFIPIPFIPFFIPIPLRKILLSIYPLPPLTDSGILPFMEKILNLFVSQYNIIIIMRKFLEDTFDFLYTSTNYIFPNFSNDLNDSFNNIRSKDTINIESNNDNQNDDDDDKNYDTNNEETKKYLNNIENIEKSDKYNRLNNEIKQNILGNTLLTTPDMNLYDINSVYLNNNINYIQQNLNSTNNYIKIYKE